jgi:hypothetical protein
VVVAVKAEVVYVDDIAPLIVAVHSELEYHWYDSVPDPPIAVAVSVAA